MTLTEESINLFVNGVIPTAPPEQKPFLEKVRIEMKERFVGKQLTTGLLLGLDSVDSLTVFHCLNHFQKIKKS